MNIKLHFLCMENMRIGVNALIQFKSSSPSSVQVGVYQLITQEHDQTKKKLDSGKTSLLFEQYLEIVYLLNFTRQCAQKKLFSLNFD